jgi:hypothetical protein
MFTLLKLGVSIVALLAFAWFGMTVKLGSRTLFEHLHAIEQTKESQELVDGTREAVRQHAVAKEVGAPGVPPPLSRDAGAPLERLSSSERRQLKYLLDKAAQ